MMRLEITAFKGLKNKTIELPEKGLVRIAGDSEVGKSTVLSAIAWALYGDEIERSVNPIGETKAGVIVTGLGNLSSITRVKGPSRLVVNESLENAVGQAEIISQLGMSSEQFGASSYIKQKLKGSLLSLGAADQIRFIQSLAFGAHDPEKYRRSIQETLTNKTNLLSTKSMILTQTQETVRKADEHLNSMSYPDVVEAASVTEITNAIALAEAKLLSMKAELEQQQSLLHHPSRKYELLISSLNEEIAALRLSLLEQPRVEQRLLDVTDQLLNHDNDLIRLEFEIQKQKLKQECTQKLDSLSQNKLPSSKEEAQNAVETADRTLVQIRQGIARLSAERVMTQDALNKSYECPACKSSLNFAEGKLHLGHDQSTKDALVGKLQWINEEEMKQKHLIIEWDKYRLLCQTQKQELEKVVYDFSLLGTVSDDDLSTLRETLVQKVSALLTEKQKLDNQYSTFKPLSADLNVKLTNLSKVSSSVVKDLPSIEHLTPIVVSLEHAITSLRIEITNLYTEYQRAVENNSLVEQIKTLRSSYEKSFEYCRTLKMDLEIADNEVRKATLEVGAINNLKKMSDEAVLSAVGSVVNSINSHLKQYVDIVFPEGGTQIYLMNESFTKKDERRAKMGLKVIHRGLEMSLDDFSGGAENRATLATQLAISDLFGSPILMLDEALTGSHPDLRDSIIDHLRTVGQSKLVLVVEHGVSDSLFDDVINL